MTAAIWAPIVFWERKSLMWTQIGTSMWEKKKKKKKKIWASQQRRLGLVGHDISIVVWIIRANKEVNKAPRPSPCKPIMVVEVCCHCHELLIVVKVCCLHQDFLISVFNFISFIYLSFCFFFLSVFFLFTCWFF